ncbi:MAG: hypothetical protein ACLQJ0_19050 [Steroidobacteraceae bacterium]|jgi:hypothetical protein
MEKHTFATSLIAGFTLAGGIVQAQAPQYVADASTDAYGEATAIATTTPSLTDAQSSYVVAAFPDADGDLEIKAWQDTTSKLVKIGEYPAGGNPIAAVAAVGLDSSHVMTADVDQTGILSLMTWTLGGSEAITALNGYDSPAGTANQNASSIGVAALSATQVVTASEDNLQNLILQAWTVGDTSAQPVKFGPETNAGFVGQLSIAALDSQTLITATTNKKDYLVITTWGVSSSGVQMQDQYVQKTQVAGTTGTVSIAAGTVTSYVVRFPAVAPSRTAVTPIVIPTDNTLEVLYWTISSSGKISKPTVKMGAPNDGTSVTAACMLPAGVPMSVFNSLVSGGSDQDILVGWFGFTGESSVTAVSGLGSGIYNVAAVAAGDDFKPLSPAAQVSAYFITAALTSTGMSPATPTPGSYRLQKWSYPVKLPNP